MDNMKLCIISLTYNRPQYIKRSFESLYKRAGCSFDHYVFDDGSNKTTVKLLKKLQEKYKFYLYLKTNRENIACSFYYAISKISDKYDVYVKLDSDVELLTNNSFKQCLEAFSFVDKKGKITHGLTPKVEGVFCYERYPDNIDFYNGHVIRYRTSIAFGCSMFFSRDVFKLFKEYSIQRLKEKQLENFGVDTKLYNFVLQQGNFLVVEDVSVYHIDNSFGQRKDFKYFTERKRWNIIDNEHVWFLRASKELGTTYISREILLKIKDISDTYQIFIKNIKKYLDNQLDLDNVVKKQQVENKQPEIKEESDKFIKVYEILSPVNFPKCQYLKRGTYKYVKELPDWAKKNPYLVVTETVINKKIYLNQLENESKS